MLAVFSVVMATSYILLALNFADVLKPNINSWFIEMITKVFGDMKGSIVHE